MNHSLLGLVSGEECLSHGYAIAGKINQLQTVGPFSDPLGPFLDIVAVLSQDRLTC